MYTIKHAAELTGLPVATLRAWERRYGVVAPERTVGGYRLYDEPTLARIRAMRDLVATGWSPRQAADEVSRADDDAPARDLPAGGEWADGDRADSELVDAARDLDTARLAAILDDRFSRGSFESVVDEWLMPALRGVGVAWAAGDLSTAAAHLAAHAVLRRLAAAQATPTPRSAGISHSSTTLSNEPRPKRSSRTAASRAVSRWRAASTSSLSARSPSAHSPPAGRSRAGASSSARDTSSAAWRGDQPVATRSRIARILASVGSSYSR